MAVCVGVRYVPDTDDEYYENEQTEDSDTSDDSNTSNNKDDKSVTEMSASQSANTQFSQLKRRLSDDDDDRAVTDGNSVHHEGASSADRVSVDKDTGEVKRLDDGQNGSKTSQLAADADTAVDKKRRKLDDGTVESTSSVNSHGMYRRCEVIR